jgi:two-component system sensor histidine kinase RegB
MPSRSLSVSHGHAAAAVVEDPVVLRLRWLLGLRWAGLLSQVVVIATSVALMDSGGSQQAMAVVGISALSNAMVQALLVRQRLRPSTTEHVVGAAIAADVILLTLLLTVSGGPLNPFTFFYVLHVTTATVALPSRWAIGIAVLATASYGVLFVPGVFDAEAHMHLMHGPGFEVHVRGMWLAFLVTAVFIVAFVSRLRTAVEAREVQLAELSRLEERSRRLAALATLAGGAAHELSTPLGTIALVADELALALQGTAPRAALDDVRLVQQEVQRCKTVLAQLATDAGTPGGETVVPLSAADLVADMCAGLSGVHIDVQHGQRHLHCQRRALGQALRGLVHNALHASHRQTVAVEVIVDGGVDGDGGTIVIRDRGHGIDDATLARIGEPFFTTKGPGEGMGLGLFLASTVVEAAGGTLRIASSAGEGTIVTVTLPFRDQP